MWDTPFFCAHFLASKLYIQDLLSSKIKGKFFRLFSCKYIDALCRRSDFVLLIIKKSDVGIEECKKKPRIVFQLIPGLN